MKLLVFGFVVGVLMLSYSASRYEFGGAARFDTMMYRHAAQGDLGWGQDGRIGWLYKPWLAPVFTPLTWGSESFAVIWWTAVLTVCYLIIVWRCLNVPLGWMVVLVTLKPGIEAVNCGNIYPILLLLVLHPLGAIVAVLFKPYVVGIVGLLALAGHLESGRRIKAHRQRYASVAAAAVVGVETVPTVEKPDHAMRDFFRSPSRT